mmetsp:Transcript_2398/g.3331  ORF Transcript_2398/g.3331 Transcript_2398/m.3331 type:complete len:282 (-) Transcript_2398:191-1036(-)
MMAELAEILGMMEYTQGEIDSVLNCIGSLRRVLTLRRETLESDIHITPGMVDELMLLKEWYIQWRGTEASKNTSVTEVFTIETWDKFILMKEMKGAALMTKSGSKDYGNNMLSCEVITENPILPVNATPKDFTETTKSDNNEMKYKLATILQMTGNEMINKGLQVRGVFPTMMKTQATTEEESHKESKSKQEVQNIKKNSELKGSMAGVLGSVYEVDPDMFIDFEIDKSATVAYMKESLSLNYKFEGVKIWFEEPPDLIVMKMREHFGSLGRPPGYIHYRQ